MKHLIKIDFIPLAIVIALLFFDFLFLRFNNYNIGLSQYTGYGLIALSLFFYFAKKQIYFYAFGLTLVLGLIGVVDMFSFGLGVTLLFSINLIYLCLLVIFLIINKEKVNGLLPNPKRKPLLKTSSAEEFENAIKIYTIKYQSKSRSELNRIANKANGYLPEAQEAASRMLGEH